MNLPNPKRESFVVEGIKGGRSKVTCLKAKLVGGFSLLLAFLTHLIGLGFWLVLPVGNLHPNG